MLGRLALESVVDKDKELELQEHYIDNLLLILDEATSALDKNTETAFLEELHSYERTYYYFCCS